VLQRLGQIARSLVANFLHHFGHARKFIEAIPHDLVLGGPLIYERKGENNYLLYGVGWNVKDEGGNGKNDDDWVWKGIPAIPVSSAKASGFPWSLDILQPAP